MIVRPARADERDLIAHKRWVILDHCNILRGWALTRRGALRTVRRWRHQDERARAKQMVV